MYAKSSEHSLDLLQLLALQTFISLVKLVHVGRLFADPGTSGIVRLVERILDG